MQPNPVPSKRRRASLMPPNPASIQQSNEYISHHSSFARFQQRWAAATHGVPLSAGVLPSNDRAAPARPLTVQANDTNVSRVHAQGVTPYLTGHSHLDNTVNYERSDAHPSFATNAEEMIQTAASQQLSMAPHTLQSASTNKSSTPSNNAHSFHAIRQPLQGPGAEHGSRGGSAPVAYDSFQAMLSPSLSNQQAVRATSGHQSLDPVPASAPSTNNDPPVSLGGQSEQRSIYPRIPYDTGAMLVQIHTKLSDHRDSQATAGTGRLMLLRHAVIANDWFFLVLHQLFTLLTIDPASFSFVAPHFQSRDFAILGKFVVANDPIESRLLQWFGTYPRPVRSYYNDIRVHDLYKRTVQAVLTCVKSLGQPLFETVTELARTKKVIVLVEDLVKNFAVHSVVLQEAISRAIALDIFAPSSQPASLEGTLKFMALHRHNSVMHNQGSFIAPCDRPRCYELFQRVYKEWRDYNRREQSLQVQSNSHLSSLSRVPFDPPSLRHFLQVPTFTRGQRPHLFTQPAMPLDQMLQRISTVQLFPSSPQQQSVLRTRVFPTANSSPRSQLRIPHTARIGLHQAHLRSPTLTPASTSASSSLLYRAVRTLLGSPTQLEERPAQAIKFYLTADTFARLAKSSKAQIGGHPNCRVLDAGSTLLRVRCVFAPHKPVTTDTWPACESKWPRDMYLQFNQNILEMRRKLHHGRDMPIDVTDYAQEGENTLKVYFNRPVNHQPSRSYYMAVEQVGVWSHEDILSRLRCLSQEESINNIKRTLRDNNAAGEEDVELTLITSNVTVELFDPMTRAAICEVPVRGKWCLHLNCFDLVTFLASVAREKPLWPALVDVWRCPICRGDVRPEMLVRDGFLDHVRDTLVSRGKTTTRAILVEKDGTWREKEEEAVVGVVSSSPESDRSTLPIEKPSAPVVILLDDD